MNVEEERKRIFLCTFFAPVTDLNLCPLASQEFKKMVFSSWRNRKKGRGNMTTIHACPYAYVNGGSSWKSSRSNIFLFVVFFFVCQFLFYQVQFRNREKASSSGRVSSFFLLLNCWIFFIQFFFSLGFNFYLTKEKTKNLKEHWKMLGWVSDDGGMPKRILWEFKFFSFSKLLVTEMFYLMSFGL